MKQLAVQQEQNEAKGQSKRLLSHNVRQGQRTDSSFRSLQSTIGNHGVLRRAEDELLRVGSAAESGPDLYENEVNQAAHPQSGLSEAETQANHTGITDSLKAGLERLSGEDVSGVTVHRNSSKPAQVNALAYTHGQDIYLGPGQENHLPHEGWHAVQQMQGRVKPTTEANGTSINDDAGLEREADVLGVRALLPTRGAKASPIRGRATTGTLQRFIEPEHEEIGDLGSRIKGKVRMVQLAAGYLIPYGDMVAMAGDHFESIEQMRRFALNTKGGPDSRAEIEYVRKCLLGQKCRKGDYDEKAMKSAEKRYYALLTKNASHFVNPVEGDEELSTKEKATKVDKVDGVDVPSNSIAGYRLNHVKAIREAAAAGRVATAAAKAVAAGKAFWGDASVSINAAMATDAFASHYLTDSFSSGHVRTPMRSIRDWWNAKVPNFFDNLQGYIAERIAEELPKVSWKYRFIPEFILYNLALGNVRERMPPMQFGDLVGVALHDWDNEKGIEATVEGKAAKLFGDSKAGEGDEKKYAIEAVKRSVKDIESAYKDGQSGIPDSEKRLLEDGLYAAERMIPKAKPEDPTPENANKRIPWKYDDPLKLLKQSDFQEALKVFARNRAGDIGNTMQSLPKDRQDAVKTGFLKPLLHDPPTVVKEVLSWSRGAVNGSDTPQPLKQGAAETEQGAAEDAGETGKP